MLLASFNDHFHTHRWHTPDIYIQFLFLCRAFLGRTARMLAARPNGAWVISSLCMLGPRISQMKVGAWNILLVIQVLSVIHDVLMQIASSFLDQPNPALEGQAFIHEVRWDTDMHSPVARKLVNESHSMSYWHSFTDCLICLLHEQVFNLDSILFFFQVYFSTFSEMPIQRARQTRLKNPCKLHFMPFIRNTFLPCYNAAYYTAFHNIMQSLAAF